MQGYLSAPQLERVQRLDPGHHARLLFFPLLWACGAALSLWAWRLPHQNGSQAWTLGLWGLGLTASALALNASFLVMHEGTHFLLSRDRARNRWLGFLTGLPIFLSFTGYQVLHVRHHEFLGDPRDPDDYSNYTGHPAKVWALHWLRLLFAGYLYLVLVPLLAWRHGKAEHRRHMIREHLLLAAFYAAVFYLVPFRILAHAWLIPTFIANFLVNARGLTQHSLATAEDPLLASRSIRTRRWIAFLYLNENYHLEHHLYPAVPFYHLPRLHAMLADRLPRALVVPSYTWFVWAFMKASLRRQSGEGVSQAPQGPLGFIVRREPAEPETADA